MTDEDISMTIKESWLKAMVDTHNKYKKLEVENQQLKMLLKECRDNIEVALENARVCESYTGTEYFKGLLAKIDNAIGGK